MTTGKKKITDQDDLDHVQLASTDSGCAALNRFPQKAALRHFTSFINSHPENTLALAMRADLRVVQMIELDEAARDAREVLRRQPGRTRMQFVLGRALILTGHYAEAVEPMEAARKTDPRDVLTLLNLALALSAGPEEYSAALKHARKAARLNPENPETHGMVSRILEASGNRNEAIRYATRALDLIPTRTANELLFGPESSPPNMPQIVTELEM